ncbi:branched-chain amino acid ABC transporter ATP-binding protein/permease [Bradyrhizobium lablabi]|uniref:branched-chain amino acid ABC transporter ATP-binding protein/permease n=1 Tax=Bradyrhizobium lablabi TaxID=722472 RepID=UPI001BAC2240|nr:ATP-binding cassette domain-containing protein [Bradyrhizobium lablabi]MBR1121018.1 branched-chain amino acid ABC transporter ATP-binding protein/permease [Bradyrhizobium lablabi]
MTYLVDVLTLTAILIVATHGYMIIKGLGGMLHLGHAVFYGLGAYGAAILSTRVLPTGLFPISLIGAAIVAAIGGLIVGWPALRNRGRYFMIVTFSIQLIFVTFVINLAVTGGPDGITSIPGLSLGPWQPTSRESLPLGFVTLTYSQLKLAVMIGFAVGSFFLCRYIIGSAYGRLVRAAREDEVVVEAHGRSAILVKLSAFVLGAAITGLAGGLFAHHFNYVGPTQFELDATMLFLVMLIVGGQYSLVGATLGPILVVLMLEALRYLLESILGVPAELTAHLRQLFFVLTLIAILSVRSNGLVPERRPRHDKQGTPVLEYGQGSPRMVDPTVDVASAKVIAGEFGTGKPAREEKLPAVLTCSGLQKRFDGVQAVADASLELVAGKIIVVIGPNGAGKTSLFNILSGITDCDAGSATLKGESIIGLSPERIARMGLARTFQEVRTWKGLTAIENILAARRDQPGANLVNLFTQPRLCRRAEAEGVERAYAVLERFGLQQFANMPSSDLSYAQRKMLSLARISAFEPDVMLLDEPTSGVDPRRLDIFLQHIRSFAKDDNKAICLIEHNMSVVKDLADWVVFMDEGRTLAAGAPDDIIGDRVLMRMYLGHRERKGA